MRVEVRLILHERSAEERRFFGIADAGIAVATAVRPKSDSVAASAPMSLELPAVVSEKHLSLEIRDRRNRRIVTLLELLSPAIETPNEDREDYLAKRKQVLASRTHFVEIDLRRGGLRPSPPELPFCDYYALICRNDDRPRVGFWPIGLRDPRPKLPIPLDAPDSPVDLDLANDATDYGKYIYAETPEPPLSAEDEAWARQFRPSE